MAVRREKISDGRGICRNREAVRDASIAPIRKASLPMASSPAEEEGEETRRTEEALVIIAFLYSIGHPGLATDILRLRPCPLPVIRSPPPLPPK